MNAISDTTAVSSDTPCATVLEEIGCDRRVKLRFPVALELQYKLLNRGRVEHLGIGRTLNISSGGVLFETDHLLPPTGFVELAIQWPFLLREVCGLKLVMRGRIVRRDTKRKIIAVKANHHEFHTAGIRSLKGLTTTAGAVSCMEST